MPHEEHVIDELLGLNINLVDGLGKHPTKLFNLGPKRAGGYTPRWVSSSSATATIGQTGQALDPIGYDHGGTASFELLQSDNNQFAIYNGTAVNSATRLSSVRSVHLPKAGAASGVGENFSNGIGSHLIYTADGVGFANTGAGFFGASTLVTSSVASGNLVLNEANGYRIYWIASQKTKGLLFAVRSNTIALPIASGGSKITVSGDGAIPPNGTVDVYLGRFPNARYNDTANGEYVYAGSLNSQNQTLELTDTPIGEIINLYGVGHPTISPNAALKKGPVEVHNSRTYFVPQASRSGHIWPFFHDTGAQFNTNAFGDIANTFNLLTVAYSIPRFFNLYNANQGAFKIAASSSDRVTAFASVEEGLIIFANNECFLMRGDPSFIGTERYENFNVLPYVPVGCDVGVIPGLLASVVYTIWKGEVYQLAGGQMQKVSEPVYLPTDPFVQVVGEVESQEIVCRTQAGKVYRYNPQYDFWYGRNAVATSYLLPNPDQHGTRYMQFTRDLFRDNLRPTKGASLLGSDVPVLAYSAVDMGVKHMRKVLHRVRVPVSWGFGGTPTLRVATPTNVGERVWNATGKRKGDTLVFTLPLGVVGYNFNLEFTFTGMKVGDSIEPPIVLEWTPRDVRR